MTHDETAINDIRAITEYVDIEAPPPDVQPTALLIFGTNQMKPAAIAAERYHQGLASLVIATGGVNRHNGIIEGREFHRFLTEHGVPDSTIRFEETSANTWQNVQFALPFLREAQKAGMRITAICKWYHRRAVHILKTLAPDIGAFHVITWEPLYSGKLVTRNDWPDNSEAKPKVIREWQEVTRRITDGTFKDAKLLNGTWQ